MIFLIYALGIALALVVLVFCNALVGLVMHSLFLDAEEPNEMLLRAQEGLVRNVFACALTGLSIGFVSLAIFPAPSWAANIPAFFVFSAIPTLALVLVVAIIAWIRMSSDTKNFPGVFTLWFLFLFFAFLPFLFKPYLPTYQGDIFELLHRLR